MDPVYVVPRQLGEIVQGVLERQEYWQGLADWQTDPDVKAQLAALTRLDLSKHVLETSRVFGGSDDRRRQWETENNLAHLLEYMPGLRMLHVPSAMNLRCDAAQRRPQPAHLALIGLAALTHRLPLPSAILP